ncbi:hypothetical protein [Halomontanus rarus]|uniref:hypothetical protein n=1 Tax=Halomontanus rarus TaxID=3034020 RepID=UPI001A980DC9
MTDTDELENRALQILKALHADYDSSAHIMMILAFAKQIQTVSDAHNASLDTIVNGDHIDETG